MTATPSGTSPRAIREPLLALAFAVLFIYAAVIGGSWLGIYVVSLRMLSLTTIALALIVWAVVAWRHPQWRPRTAIWPAIGVPLAAFALSTATSPYPRLGLEYLCWAVLLAALYLLLVRILATEFMRARIGGLAAIVGILTGLAYVLFAVRYWVEWWSLVGRLDPPPLRPAFIGLTWGNPSAVLTVSVLLLLIAFAGLGTATRAHRITLMVQAALTLFVVVVSGSRAGWIALLGALVLVAVPWLLVQTRNGAVGRALADRRVRAALVVVGVVGIVLAVTAGPGIAARIEGGGDGGRPVYYATAMRMFAEAPLLGTGPGTWAARRIAYTESGELDFYIPHAHNVYFQGLAELGVVGIASQLVALACGVWLVYRAVAGKDPVVRRWGWVVLFGFVYAGIHDLFDSYANMPAVLMLLAVPVAWLDGRSDRAIGLPAALARYARPLAAAAGLALVLAAGASVVVLARAESVAAVHDRAVALMNDGDVAGAVDLAGQAATADPDLPPYRLTYALAALAAGRWEEAAQAFRAAAVVDDLPQAWLGLTAAQVELGVPKLEVAASLGRAMRVGYQQPALAYAAGVLYDRMGLTDEANRAWVAALGAAPALAADPTWSRDADAAARFETILDRAIETYPEVAWELALMAEDPERALSLVPPAAGYDLWRTIIAAWEGNDDAVDLLLAQADALPMDGIRLAWAARVSDRVGDPERADRYRRLVQIGMPGAPAGEEARVRPFRPRRDAVVANRTLNYGTYMYRRPTPWDLLPAHLPHLVPARASEVPAEGS